MVLYMSRAPHRPDSVTTPVQVTARGISAADVDRAADTLLRAGQRPTIEKVRAKIGRGSPNTINPLLDAWWQRLAGRLDAGPAALHRLPEPVLLAAEGLWLQTLDEARKRATAEQGSRKTTLAKDAQDLEVRAHVLSIRESEQRDRIAQAEQRTSQLAIEIEALTTLLRKSRPPVSPSSDDWPRLSPTCSRRSPVAGAELRPTGLRRSAKEIHAYR